MTAVPQNRHISYQRQYRKCGKPCKTCQEGPGHGPYVYAYWKENGRMHSAYVGKQNPSGVTVAPVPQKPSTTEASTAAEAQQPTPRMHTVAARR